MWKRNKKRYGNLTAYPLSVSGQGNRRGEVSGLLRPAAVLVLVMAVLAAVVLPALAQEPPIGTSIVPGQASAGTSTVVTITGTGLTADTQVRLLGYASDIPSTFNTGAGVIQAVVPANVPVGQYLVELSNPNGTRADLIFFVNAVIPTPEPPTAVPPPTPAPPPTEIPGQPSLLVRSFRANPATIQPGGGTTFTLDIVNQGTRPSLGGSLVVDAGGKFTATGGQATVLLPDLPVGGSTQVNLAVVSARDTAGGPQGVSITLSYRDFSGTAYTSKASLTVEVAAVPLASQVTLARYQITPNPVIPGEPATVLVLLTNTGNDDASQVLVTIPADGLLLAGPQGNSFPLGTLPAGSSAAVEMPLIVSSSAKAGPQSQSLSISFLQGTEAKTSTATITIEVAKVEVPAPVMIVDSYETGFEYLEPGQVFTLTLAIQNIGDDNASGLLVTFGQVDSSGGGIDPTPGTPGSTTTTTSSTFAPLASGGTQFVGEVPLGGDPVTIRQDFIVNGSVDSGVYPLPITLRYSRSDGTTSQDNLRASLVVLVPPTIRITESSPLPETAFAFEPLSFALEIANRGRKPVNFTTAEITAENASIDSEAETFLGPVRNDDQTSLDIAFTPQEEGPVTITVVLNYTDDLNRPNRITQTYELTAEPPPPPPDFGEPPPDFGGPQPSEPELTDRDILGKLLLGLLGLGS